MVEETNENDHSTGCCARLRHEFASEDPYDLDEPSGENVSCDVQKAFAPRGKSTLLVRIVLVLYSLSIVFLQLKYYMDRKNSLYFFFYVTHWTLLMNVAYLSSALYMTWLLLSSDSTSNSMRPTPDAIKKAMKTTWTLYAIAAPAGLSVIVLYWTLDYNPAKSTIDFRNVSIHGGVALCVLLDGAFISSVPVRASHLRFYFYYFFSYMVFNICHDYSGIGDGDWKGEDPDDPAEDSLYVVLSWTTNFGLAAAVASFQGFILIPLTFFACWWLALLQRRGVVVTSDGGSTANKGTPVSLENNHCP
mmetsp:Transcript_38752/g.90076  ORF Transcript_38752/g.90076 Transcript_38752/m.90076 type:complete len:304 (-) Transcript_38752:217-1128(-)